MTDEIDYSEVLLGCSYYYSNALVGVWSMRVTCMNCGAQALGYDLHPESPDV